MARRSVPASRRSAFAAESQHTDYNLRRVARLLNRMIVSSLLAALAQGQSDATSLTVAVRVVRDIGERSGTATPIADVSVDQVVQRNGRDSLVATARTAMTGDAQLRIHPEMGGVIRVRAIGFIAQRIALPASGDVPIEVRLKEQPLALDRICICAWGQGVVLKLRAREGTVPLPLHVRIWTSHPRKVWVDARPVLMPGADTTMGFDAPVGRPYNISMSADGYRKWRRYAVVPTGNRACGMPGVVLDAPLRRRVASPQERR
jgi:hypothetical protein